MPDISKCSGNECPVKNKCYRYTSMASEFRQSYINPPFEIKDGVVYCDLFWNENQTNILNQLKDIVNGKK